MSYLDAPLSIADLVSNALKGIREIGDANLLLDLRLAVPLLALLCFVSVVRPNTQRIKVPLVGSYAWYEPAVIANFRFFRNGRSILEEGYAKFKDHPFKIIRFKQQLLVLPGKYVKELRNLPISVANPIAAQIDNLMGRYTHLDLVTRSNLHFRTLQEKLTPNLGSVNAPLQEEMNYAFEVELPTGKDQFVPIQPYYVVRQLVARTSARIFVGYPLCREEQWLEASQKFTENVFKSVMVLKLFPTWMHWPLSLVLPVSWKATFYLKQAQRILSPEIAKIKRSITADKTVRIEDRNLLSWMIEVADENEQDPLDIAHHELIISLASIHSTQTTMVHVLYELADRSEYIGPIREEILRVISEEGPLTQWKKSSYSKLHLLDSFMKESQRFNPLGLLAFHRVMRQDMILSDGYELKEGYHICMLAKSIQNDPNNTPNPDTFDGYRYAKLRADSNEANLHQWTTMEPYSLNFGNGKYACPGRFFAAMAIKSMLIRLIMDYDFRFDEDKGRPDNLMVHEFIFPNPDGQLLVKRRNEEVRLKM